MKCSAVSAVTTRVQMLSFSIDTAAESFLPLVHCTVDDTLFELGPEIRCPGV